MRQRTTWRGSVKPLWLKHERDDEGDFGKRALMHIPIGYIMGLLPFSSGLNKLFRAYEENEDLHTQDEAWKDYFGAMVGYIPGRLTLIGLCIWAVLVLLARLT